MKHRFLSLLLVLALCLALMPVSALALEIANLEVIQNAVAAVEIGVPAEEAQPEQEPKQTAAAEREMPVLEAGVSGACGDGITWSLDENGVLTVRGMGKMPDYAAIGKTPWFTSYDKITAVVIESGITHVGNSAFANCGAITSVTLASTVESIGDEAFNCLPKLTSLTLPEGLESIGEFAFSFNGLTELKLPESLKILGDSAFNPSNSLTEITLPGGLESIGSGAFGVCENLKTITVSEGIADFGTCFINCYAAETMNLPSTIQALDENFIIPGEQRSLKIIIVAEDKVDGLTFWGWKDENGDTYTSAELLVGKADGSTPKGHVTAIWMNAPNSGVGETVSGDVSGDGAVTTEDLVLLMKCVLGVEEAVEDAADVNEDGKIDILDILRMIRYLSGESI